VHGLAYHNRQQISNDVFTEDGEFLSQSMARKPHPIRAVFKIWWPFILSVVFLIFYEHGIGRYLGDTWGILGIYFNLPILGVRGAWYGNFAILRFFTEDFQ